MSDLNSVVVVGRLVRTVTAGMTTGGTATAEFSLALNRVYYDSKQQRREEVSFFDCRVFGRAAEVLEKYTRQGSRVGVKGRLTQSRWEQDGQRRSKVWVMVEELQLLSEARGSEAGEASESQGAAAPSPEAVAS